MAKKNPAAVALGKLAARKRSKKDLQQAGRLGGLRKAENHKARERIADIADAVHDHFSAVAELPTPSPRLKPTKKGGKNR